MTGTFHIAVAMKPTEGTFAQNALKHGVAGLWIDGCRIGFVSDADEAESKVKNRHADFGSGPKTNAIYGKFTKDRGNYDPQSRFPANVILDGSGPVLAAFPICKGGTWNRTDGARPFNNDGSPTNCRTTGKDTSVGSASRFFKQVEEFKG